MGADGAPDREGDVVRLREMSPAERALVDRMIECLPLDVSRALRAQSSSAMVADPGDGILALSLKVPSDGPRALLPNGPVPVSALVWDGSDYQGELLLFVVDGIITLFEYAWVTDEKPTGFPDPDDVVVEQLAGGGLNES